MGTVSSLYEIDPAQAGSFLQSLTVVEEGLGGGNELAGGLWVLILSWAALRVGELSKPLNFVGRVIGVSGLSTIVPPIAFVTGTIFGLGFIVWFAWAVSYYCVAGLAKVMRP